MQRRSLLEDISMYGGCQREMWSQIWDGIAKALGKQKHQNFMKMINLGMGNRIPREQHQDELKEQIQKARVQGVEDEPVQYR